MRKYQSSIQKKNMVRTCYACLTMSVIALLIICLLGLFDIPFLPENLRVSYSITIEAYLLLFFGLTYYAVRSKMRDQYSRIVNFFWGGLLCIFIMLSIAASTSTLSIMLYWIGLMLFSLIPIYDSSTFSLFMCVQFLLSIITMIKQEYTYDQILFVLIVNVAAFVLSHLMFNEVISQLKYRSSLSNARNVADTDPMTQLLNRRGLDRQINSIWPYCARQKTDVAVIMMDIDNFKLYNDSFGHPQGDECIKEVAGQIQKDTRRKTDIAARVGGEEFLVFLTGIDSAGALRWAATLKKNIEGLQITHSKENFLPYVTVSMGLVTCTADMNKNFSSICDEADRALYHAKSSGRACVSFNKRIYGKRHVVTPNTRTGSGG